MEPRSPRSPPVHGSMSKSGILSTRSVRSVRSHRSHETCERTSVKSSTELFQLFRFYFPHGRCWHMLGKHNLWQGAIHGVVASDASEVNSQVPTQPPHVYITRQELAVLQCVTLCL